MAWSEYDSPVSRVCKVYFRSQILVYQYHSILERENVPVSVDAGTAKVSNNT